MNLENEIGLKSFRNEWQKASINILYTHGLLFNAYESFFKNFGMTTQQYNVLRILREQYPKPVSTSYLRERMLDKMSDASRLVNRLQVKGMVDVTQNPSDKRLVDILLSEEALNILETIDGYLPELDNKLKGLTKEEAEELASLLSKVRTSLKEIQNKENTN